MWKAIGAGNVCPDCGHVTQVETNELGQDRERCYTCWRTLAVVTPSPRLPEPAIRPAVVRKRVRYQGAERPCAAGTKCLGDGFLARRRGRPRANGLCDSCTERAA